MLRQNPGCDSSLQEIEIDSRALVDLISNVENCLEDGIFYFKFSALRELYRNRLSSLELEKEINKVRFKEQVLEHFSNAQQQTDGKNLVLVFEQGMKNSMPCEENAMTLMKVAKIIHNDILSLNGLNFDAYFEQGCQQDSVPMTLQAASNYGTQRS